MAIVFNTPKSALNTTSGAIQVKNGDNLQSKEVTINEEGEFTIKADNGYYGLSEVDITVDVPSDVHNQNVSVSPETTQQVITPEEGYTGLGQVTVGAVTSAIDNNITAGNIKKDVTILGVTGNFDPTPNLSNLNITPSTNAQEYNPAISGVDGYSLVRVNAVTSSIDQNINAGNIKDGVTILGVQGSFQGGTLQNKSVTPTTSQQSVTADSPNYGLGTVTVAAVTSAIDANIQPQNILDGVTILGVAGSDAGYDAGYTEGQTNGYNNGYADGETAGYDAGYADGQATCPDTPVLDPLSVTPTTSAQHIYPEAGVADGFSDVSVAAVTSSIDQNILSNNIKNGVTILGVTGSYTAQPNLQSKSVSPTTSAQTVSADGGYDGLSQVSVSAVTSAIDNNIQAGNIKNGVTILGVQGTYTPVCPQPRSYAVTFEPTAVGTWEDQPDQTQGDYFSSVTIQCQPDIDGTVRFPYTSETIDAYDSVNYENGSLVYFKMYVGSGVLSGKYYVAEDGNGNELSISKYLDDGQGGLTFPANFDLEGREILVRFEPRNAIVNIDDSDPNEELYTISILGCELIAVDGNLNQDDWFNSFTSDCYEDQLMGGITVGRHYPGGNECGLDAYYFTYVNVPTNPSGGFFSPLDISSSEAVEDVNNIDFDDAYIAMTVDSGAIDPTTGYYDAEDLQGNIFHIKPYEDNPNFDPNDDPDPVDNPEYIFPQNFNVVGYEIQCYVAKDYTSFNEDDSDPNIIIWTMEANDVEIEGIQYNGDRDTWSQCYFPVM